MLVELVGEYAQGVEGVGLTAGAQRAPPELYHVPSLSTTAHILYAARALAYLRVPFLSYKGADKFVFVVYYEVAEPRHCDEVGACPGDDTDAPRGRRRFSASSHGKSGEALRCVGLLDAMTLHGEPDFDLLSFSYLRGRGFSSEWKRRHSEH